MSKQIVSFISCVHILNLFRFQLLRFFFLSCWFFFHLCQAVPLSEDPWTPWICMCNGVDFDISVNFNTSFCILSNHRPSRRNVREQV